MPAVEIDQRTVTLNTLRDLRGDFPSPLGGRGDTSKAYWTTSVAGDVDKKVADLAKQKSKVITEEKLAEMAARNTETEARLLWYSLFICI